MYARTPAVVTNRGGSIYVNKTGVYAVSKEGAVRRCRRHLHLPHFRNALTRPPIYLNNPHRRPRPAAPRCAPDEAGRKSPAAQRDRPARRRAPRRSSPRNRHPWRRQLWPRRSFHARLAPHHGLRRRRRQCARALPDPAAGEDDDDAHLHPRYRQPPRVGQGPPTQGRPLPEGAAAAAAVAGAAPGSVVLFQGGARASAGAGAVVAAGRDGGVQGVGTGEEGQGWCARGGQGQGGAYMRVSYIQLTRYMSMP